MDLNRKAAYEVLLAMEKNESYSNIELNKTIEKGNPPSPSFVRELVYGVTENRIYLDYIIDKLAAKGLKGIKKDALTLLRMGIYQIKFMNSVPEYAAVNETVSLARKVLRGREGFINGVLRGYLKKGAGIELPDREKDEAKYLSVRYSCALWIVKLWLKQFGSERCEKILAFGNSVPPVTVRVNTLKTDVNELTEKLQALGFETEKSSLADRAVFIKGSGFLETDIYRMGDASVQNEESVYAAITLSPEPGEQVIDMCAAPGGKTCALAEIMENRGNIKGFDIYEHRVQLINKQAKRLGIEIIDAQVRDAAKLDEALIETADKVLCDVPCSGLGVIRRKPEIKYKDEPDDINQLSNLQLRILENAGRYLKPGGKIVYSTCTINRLENEDVIKKFLSENGEFELLEQRQLMPDTEGSDGFFVALMEKAKDCIGGA